MNSDHNTPKYRRLKKIVLLQSAMLAILAVALILVSVKAAKLNNKINELAVSNNPAVSGTDTSDIEQNPSVTNAPQPTEALGSSDMATVGNDAAEGSSGTTSDGNEAAESSSDTTSDGNDAAVPTKEPDSETNPEPTVVPQPTIAPTSAAESDPTLAPTAPPKPTATPTSTPAPASTQKPTSTPAPTATPKPTSKPGNVSGKASDCSVSANGQLQVIGTQLCNSKGQEIILRGISTAGIAWFPDIATPQFMKTLHDEWNIGVFRIAMYDYEGDNSYLRNPNWNKSKVCTLIDAAIDLDMYVIVDWHILADGNPQTNQKEAIEFFTYIASKYPKSPYILYEICNEPNGGITWSGNVKPYAEEVIPVIRKYSPNAVILVGSPTWSQDVDQAANDPLKFDNIMYSLHFYAGTHKEWLRNKADTALSKGLAIFVTEWGTTDASGNGNVDTASSDEWLDYLDRKKISWCNWSLCNKNESSAILKPSASTSGAMPDSSLTKSGLYVKTRLLSYADGSQIGSEVKPTPIPEATPTPKPSKPISAGTANALTLLSYNEIRDDSTNTLAPRIRIANNSDEVVSLDHLSILYYYTPESDVDQNLWCDYADINGMSYRAITEAVTGEYSKNDGAMRITFTADAGNLEPGETVTLQLRITNGDWSSYSQGNDASFDADDSDFTLNKNLKLIAN